MSARLPVTTIAGYLGSGKTTLINYLLRNADGLRLAVLVNEFGELAIDEDLIEAESDDVISIAGGCICCSFGNDLTAALLDLSQLDPQPDHILVEASGVAIPGSVASSISLLDTFSSDGIVVLADAETIESSAQNKYMGDTIARQLGDADIIILNKADLVEPHSLEATKHWLDDQNDQVTIIDTTFGKVPPEVILSNFLGRDHSTNSHLDAVHLDMMTLRPTGRLNVDVFSRTLAKGDLGIIRAKGFATSLDGTKQLVQIVGRRWATSPATDNFADGIVCLGFKKTLNRTALAKLCTP